MCSYKITIIIIIIIICMHVAMYIIHNVYICIIVLGLLAMILKLPIYCFSAPKFASYAKIVLYCTPSSHGLYPTNLMHAYGLD